MKLSVGSVDIPSLIKFQSEILQKRISQGGKKELYHRTRMMPKRKQQLLSGGSIYWVVKAKICMRQTLIDLRPIIYNNLNYCIIVFDAEPILTEIVSQRPFRGWRYLKDEHVPKDIEKKTDEDYLPQEIDFLIF